MTSQTIFHQREWRALFAAILVAILSLTLSGKARAQDTADSSAVVLQPLELVNTTDLEFGSLIAGNTAGTVTINAADDGRTLSGNLVGGSQNGAAARFLTFGGPLQFIFVSRGPLPVLTRDGGSETMNVSALTLNGPAFRFLGAAGVLDLRVGGTLQVNADQAPGTYRGTFQINVTYF
ncbi:DUF4402 domain-containing protein [Parasphingorhabdus sp. DH2-15]|uniref:DUF4402 domain-containing protein n=1 Tax=Parasphingorhabdus sp. DH2-15 TaxID=3444112 RepID=UPI003F68285E